ncbi:hypothetical protein BG004_003005 [Podila humilis]|nr:hypothetical protein BG004_003005 [Podila humilis]
MFDIPELVAIVSSYLTKNDLAMCCQVSMKWNEAFTSHCWRHIDVNRNQAIIFLTLLVEDYYYERDGKRLQKHREELERRRTDLKMLHDIHQEFQHSQSLEGNEFEQDKKKQLFLQELLQPDLSKQYQEWLKLCEEKLEQDQKDYEIRNNLRTEMASSGSGERTSLSRGHNAPGGTVIGRHGHYIHVIAWIEGLWRLLEHVHSYMEGEADPMAVDDIPPVIDLLYHLFKQCPNAKVDEFTFNEEHIARIDDTGEQTNPKYYLAMLVLPRVKLLHVDIACGGLTKESLREILVTANARCLEDLAISALTFDPYEILSMAPAAGIDYSSADDLSTGAGWLALLPEFHNDDQAFDSDWNDDNDGDGDDAGSTGSAGSVFTVRPKRIRIDINDDNVAIKVLQMLGPASNQVKELEIGWLTEPLAHAIAAYTREFMPRLDSVVVGYHVPPAAMVAFGEHECPAGPILQACTRGLVSVEFKHTVGVDPITWTMLLEHASTLERVTLREYEKCDIVRLLRTCPRLKTLVAGDFDPGYQGPMVWVGEADFIDADPESDGKLRPWLCEQSLEALSIYLDFYPSEYSEYKDTEESRKRREMVMRRLGRFKKLKSLELRSGTTWHDERDIAFLPFTLSTGLNELQGLKDLRDLRLGNNLMDLPDLNWIIQQCPRFEVIGGLSKEMSALVGGQFPNIRVIAGE